MISFNLRILAFIALFIWKKFDCRYNGKGQKRNERFGLKVKTIFDVLTLFISSISTSF